MALGTAHPLRRPVRLREPAFLVRSHAGETVVGRVAKDHEDRFLLFHPFRAVALFLEFRERQRFVRARLPSGERIGEEDTGLFRPVVGQGCAEILQGEPDLQVRDDEGRGHDLEAEHPPCSRLPHLRAGECAKAAAFEMGGDAAQHFRQIGPPVPQQGSST